jgi:hypothetical protein
MLPGHYALWNVAEGCPGMQFTNAPAAAPVLALQVGVVVMVMLVMLIMTSMWVMV